MKINRYTSGQILCLIFFSLYWTPMQGQVEQENKVPSFKIRKKVREIPFQKALALPQTATSCDCTPVSYRSTSIKLGCQHPDTAAVCKVVITAFDVAIATKDGQMLVYEEVGSYVTGRALSAIKRYAGEGTFISYTNIKGMTEDGTKVVVPSFGTQQPLQRAVRNYISINTYLPNLIDTKVHSFEMIAYNENNQMVFRQSFNKDSFDRNVMRPDAARYVFKDIKAQHTSGFYVDVANFEVSRIESFEEQLLSSNN